MNTNYNSNPYTQQVLDKGRDLPKASASKKQFPCTIGARYFETEAEYQEALADFLNGYWYWAPETASVVWLTLSPFVSGLSIWKLQNTLDLSTLKMTHKIIAMPATVRYL